MSKWCQFIGYKSDVKGYKLWDPEAFKVVISINIIFDKIVILCGSFAKKFNPTSHRVLTFKWNLKLIIAIHLSFHLKLSQIPS